MIDKGSPAADKPKSPWRYAILVPYIGAISAVTAWLTGPVAIVAVPVVDALVLGAFAWDIRNARKEEAALAAAEQADGQARRPAAE